MDRGVEGWDGNQDPGVTKGNQGWKGGGVGGRVGGGVEGWIKKLTSIIVSLLFLKRQFNHFAFRVVHVLDLAMCIASNARCIPCFCFYRICMKVIL